jgi:hypothetical protein
MTIKNLMFYFENSERKNKMFQTRNKDFLRYIRRVKFGLKRRSKQRI